MLDQISVKPLFRIVFVLSLAAMGLGWNASPSALAQGKEQASLDRFDRLTESTGWILLDEQLFWTSDAGQSWQEITPALPGDAKVQAVKFLDVTVGWILWTMPAAEDGASYHLAHTIDSGKTWTSRDLALFEAGEIGSYLERAEMGWFDAQTGWIAVKQMSGSNFSLGTLFSTADGGNTWSRFSLPVADQIYFGDLQSGWAAGGPAGNELFHTADGGLTWHDVSPFDISDEIPAVLFAPFVSGGEGLLVAVTSEPGNNLNVYSLEKAQSWSLHAQTELDVSPSVIGLSILDERNVVATVPGTTSIVRMVDGEIEVLNNEDGLLASIVELDMISLSIGWGKSIDSKCRSGSCSSSARLLQTTDGGLTWQRVQLPIVPSAAAASRDADIPPGSSSSDAPAIGNTEVFLGQGFDRCEIPSLAQMRAWVSASPYKTVNLYIGGSSRACANSAITSSFVSELYRQGWKFIPTWVGPQAPCTGYRSRMGYDVSEAFGQGVSEANLAVERLAALGLTAPDKTGSVVYYDIEPYGTDATCRAAVNAFMNGWVSQLHARGNMAGVYGSTLCNTAISDFRFITHMPDVIWPARWYHNLGEGYYDPTANVWNLGSCIPNTVWSNHQRIRQYEGDHAEIWGGLVLDLDSNAVDGVVAIPDTIPVEVKIAATTLGPYKFVPRQIRHQSFITVDSGPVQLISPTGVPLIGSERVIHKVNGIPVSFTEMMALPKSQLDTTYWLPWYNNKELNTQLRFANISDQQASVHVSIGGVEMAGSPFLLAPGESTRKSFPGIDRGPVKIESSVNIVAAERVIYNVNGVDTSFSEMMAMPASQVDTTYWLPWYNNKDLNTQLRFANISDQEARVHVSIGGIEMNGSPFTIAPGMSLRRSFPGIDRGPVKIESNVNIIAAERVIYNGNGVDTSFTEMMAIPASQADNTHWLPWYNNKDLDTQIRFANISNQQATVRVYIDGTEMSGSPFSLAAGASIRRSFPGVDAGPVRIESSVNILAAERVIYRVNGVPTSFTEMMALPQRLLDNTYWLPWYNNVELDTQLRFGIP